MEEGMPSPWKTGEFGRAWQCDLEGPRQRDGIAPEDATALGMWVIEAKWAHPVWHSYAITLVHLRPMPDARETLLYRDDASHEFVLWALDPDKSRAPIICGTGPMHHLTPPNFAAQLAEPSDEAALTRMEWTIDRILSGELNPDTDATSAWVRVFGDAMLKGE